jgi:transposase
VDAATVAAKFEQLERQRQEIVEARNRETAEREKAEADREHYRKLYLELLERCRRLEQGLLGQKAERLPPDEAQLSLSVLATLLGSPEAPTISQKVRGHERRKPTGRKPLPEDLPRVDIEVLPDDVRREGLDAFEKIGEEVSEVVERRRASVVVVRLHRGKYLRKDRERNAETQVLVGEPLDLPIPRGMAGPGLIADTLTKRFCDSLPLHRQERIFARDGLPLARSTICRWHIEVTALCKPLVDAMWHEALTVAPYLCIDATGVLVQAKEKCRHGHFWVVIAAELHVLFGYSPQHNGDAVDSLLVGYAGYLVADAHAVYDHLYATGKILEVGCWGHARRYFFKALTSEPELAREGLALIDELFRIERKLASVTPKQRKKARIEHSKPVVGTFFDWCHRHANTVLDDTPIARAVGYASNQEGALRRFLDDGRLPIHNNGSERELRREAVGRKNWLFVGNDDAAEVNTTFVSLIASCQMHGIEPYAYLRDLLCLIPQWPKSRVLELAPAHWRKTLEQTDAQQRLAANVFRQVALGELTPHGPEG